MAVKSKNDIAITFTEPVPKQFGELDGEPAHDEFSRMMKRIPARALGTLERITRDAGYCNVQSINSYHHGNNGDYTSENYRRFFSSYWNGFGAITRTAKQTLQLSRRVKSVNPKTKIILGGPHFTINPEEGLEYGKADVVCIGECEETLSEILGSDGDPDRLQEVRGIAFKKGSEIITTPQRDLLNPEKFVHPYYDDVTRSHVNIGVIQGSRGCLYHCDHCQEALLNRGKYRSADVDYVIEERRKANEMGKTVFHVDDFISGNKKRLIEYSHAIKEAGLDKRFALCQITSKSLRDLEIQQALIRMGIKMVCVGYEYVLDSGLQDIGKPCSAEDNNEACRILRELGIWNHGMIMTGGKDTKESLEYTLEWAIKNLDSAQFFPIGNLSGTPFDRKMRAESRVLVDGIDNYSLGGGHEVVVRADNLSPYEQQVITDNMYYRFYSLKNNLKRLAKAPLRFKRLLSGIMLYTNVRGGLDRVAKSKEHLAHLEFLKSIS